MALPTRALALAGAAGIAACLYALALSVFTSHLPFLTSYLPSPFHPSSPQPYTCPNHTYTTHLISLSPLLILIPNFLPPSERHALISLGVPLLTASPITGSGSDSPDTNTRTSSSAPLPVDDSVVSCVPARAGTFLRPSLLRRGRDDMGMPQMVRYTAGQRFDVHADWFGRPRLDPRDGETGRRRLYNRAATIFVVLENNSTAGGETRFPKINLVEEEEEEGRLGGGDGGEREVEQKRMWRVHEDGGIAFKPVAGNALFWVNLLPDGTGDAHVVHAGLPIWTASRRG